MSNRRLIPPNAYPKANGSKNGIVTCKYCPKDSYMHCVKCSDYSTKVIVSICSPDTGRTCYSRHLDEHYMERPHSA